MNVVITGVTSGLGKALVNEISKNKNFKIIGIYRNKKKIDTRVFNKKINLIKCDFSQKKSVEKLLKKIKKIKKIDCLINNHASLGILNQNSQQLFYTNYFSIQKFTFAILKYMKKSKKKLVINISSHAHNIKNYNNINLNEMNNWEVYKFSKVCLILLSKKLAQKGIKSISINPGRMRTNFGNQFFGSFFIKIYLYVMGKNPINIAEKINTIIKSGNFKNGHYYSNFKKTNPSISAINTQKIMKFLNSFKS